MKDFNVLLLSAFAFMLLTFIFGINVGILFLPFLLGYFVGKQNVDFVAKAEDDCMNLIDCDPDAKITKKDIGGASGGVSRK